MNNNFFEEALNFYQKRDRRNSHSGPFTIGTLQEYGYLPNSVALSHSSGLCFFVDSVAFLSNSLSLPLLLPLLHLTLIERSIYSFLLSLFPLKFFFSSHFFHIFLENTEKISCIFILANLNRQTWMMRKRRTASPSVKNMTPSQLPQASSQLLRSPLSIQRETGPSLRQ